MLYDSILNAGEYFSNYFLEELLPGEVAKTHAKGWNETDRVGCGISPRKRLLDLRAGYQRARTEIVNADVDKRRAALSGWHAELLAGLGYNPEVARSAEFTNCGQVRELELAYESKTVFAVECEFRELAAEAIDLSEFTPLTGEFDNAAKLASWLFGIDDNAPKYLLLLCGGLVVVCDIDAFREGRYLAVSVATVLERNDRAEAGLACALTARELLEPMDAAEPDQTGLSQLVTKSREQAQGVSKSLREGLRRSVEVIAKEVLDRLREQDFDWTEYFDDREFAKKLTTESLRYLYRILFLLFAEARPELQILPTDSPEYQAGYSMARLSRTAERQLPPEAHDGTYLYESLALLFEGVNDGYPNNGEAGLLVFEPLQSKLFDHNAIRLIGENLEIDDTGLRWSVDTRLRNRALHKVLRMLMIDDGVLTRRRGRRGQTQFVSYAKLGINQLGAVYEGLMSYTGRIARGETLYEVAQAKDLKENNNKPKDGSWLVPQSEIDAYENLDVIVTDEDPFTSEKKPVTYSDGSFVYRLAGRDRQTSASYYTPESLTKTTVELTLRQRIIEQGGEVAAAELLKWRVLEPALGSGAFLNEAINQVAAKYLELRQTETGRQVEPEQYEEELRKVKAYIALHNAYGVDLNDTATELAEVSLWLNVMYPGLKSPWFGLHLRHGNSLIGARRETYGIKDLAPGKKQPYWYDLAPRHNKLSETPAGQLDADRIHHFLLPSKGWASVADHKEAKSLEPGDTKALAKWRSGMTRKLKPKQAQRAKRLARQVEYLWDLVVQRLRLSERAIARDIDVWGAPELAERSGNSAIDKQEILDDLTRPGGPFWRLRKLMDAWCSLWFWPVGKTELLTGPVVADPDPRRPRNLRDIDDWFAYCEALVGRMLPTDHIVVDEVFTNLPDLDNHEQKLTRWMDMQDCLFLENVNQKFAFVTELDRIGNEQHFFHWELWFAHVFTDGGFDIQVGNPPWYRPRWDEDSILSERDPRYLLANWNTRQKDDRKAELLANEEDLNYFLSEAASNAGLSSFVDHCTVYNLLTGTQANLYRCFMIRTWENAKPNGAIGLIHPDSHLTGAKEGRLRSAAYRTLRIHGHIVNERKLFDEVDNHVEYGTHIYSGQQEINFVHISWAYDPIVISGSLSHDGSGERPGLKVNNSWDIRPHRSRIVQVNRDVLAEWNKLPGTSEDPVDETKILYPVTTAELEPIAKLAEVSLRFSDLNPDITHGFHESVDKRAGYFEDIDKSTTINDKPETKRVDSWSMVILQGPHFAISTPLAKTPRSPLKSNKDWDPIDLTTLPESSVALTNYLKPDSLDADAYREKQDNWVDHDLCEQLKTDPEHRRQAKTWLLTEGKVPAGKITDDLIDARLMDESKKPYTDFWRMAWREMIPLSTERSLFPALIPPGPAHVNAVHSANASDLVTTVASVGFYSSIVLDYFLRVNGISHLNNGNVRTLPSVSPSHPLASALILRTLRLNCLTDVYAPLWEELYDVGAFANDSWVFPWPSLAPLNQSRPVWDYNTPLRTECERRAALIEIDALTAVMLAITEDQLKAIYTGRFAVLSGREEQTWFDADGNRICGDTKAAGYKQSDTTDPDGSRNAKLPFQQLTDYLSGERSTGPNGFHRFPKASGLAYYRANRLGMPTDEEYPHGVNGNAEADTLGEYAYAHREFSRRLAELTVEN